MLQIKQIPLERVYALRHKVLRPNQALESCYYVEDSWADVFHLGAVNEQDEVLAIASFYPQECPEQPKVKAFRLRGMACQENLQGQGLGSQLLKKGLEICQQQQADLLWCNARSEAVGFYSRLQFKKLGAQFEIESIGPHFVMAKSL